MTNLILEHHNHVLLITINRPKTLNALNFKLLEELALVLDKIESDDNVKTIIITGAEEKSFVAGADIRELSGLDKKQALEIASKWHKIIFNRIEDFSKPIICAVNGYALGGGLELAMACHIRLASENAFFGLPEVKLGLIPGYGGTQRLTKLIGKSHAMYYTLSSQTIPSKKAFEIGLVSEVLKDKTNLINRALKLAENIIENCSLKAVSKAIESINAYDKIDGYNIEIENFSGLFQESDFVEGTSAFLEKRKPNFNKS